jgi:hypothetical protein
LTDNEAAHEQLACGSPFLVATKAGYSTSYLNRPIEVFVRDQFVGDEAERNGSGGRQLDFLTLVHLRPS